MTIGIFDFLCADCANAFELFVRSAHEKLECPRCKSSSIARQPVLQIALRKARHGRVVDLSSNACPCGADTGRHGKRP